MANAFDTQIKDRITAFAQELDLLVRKNTIEALQNMLAGAAPARRGRPAGAARRPGRPKGGRPRSASVEEAAEKVVAHVRANDGQGIGAIAQATGLDLKAAKKAALHLVASGGLKKTGQKRGTVYHIGSGRAPRAKVAKRGKTKARKGKRAKKAQKRGPRAMSKGASARAVEHEVKAAG